MSVPCQCQSVRLDAEESITPRRRLLRTVLVFPLIALIFGFLHQGCVSGSDKDGKHYSFAIVDTIHFKNSQSHDIPSTEVKYKMVNGRSLISFYDYLDNSILIYDLSTDSCMKVNVQNAIGPNMSILADYMINGYFIRSLDSIYVLLNPLNEIHLIDSNGSWLKRWVVSSERPGTNRGYYLLSFFGDAPIEMIGDDLVTLQQLPDPDYGVNQSLRKIKYSSFIDAVIAFDGDTAKVVSQIGR